MTDLIQIVAVSVSAALLALVLELVRRRRLTEEYSVLWVLCGTALLVFSVWRDALHLAARALGIYYPPAVLILLLVFFVFVVSLSFSVVVSRQRQQIERMIEDQALMDRDLRELRSRIGSITSEQVVPGPADHRGEPGQQRRVG
jgi:hypothetical protein